MIRNKSRLLAIPILLLFIIALLTYFFLGGQRESSPPTSLNAEYTKLDLPQEKTADPIALEAKPTKGAPKLRSELLGAKKIAELRVIAKMNLASVYGGQKAFYAEYGRYTSDLLATGYMPNLPLMNFKMGFLSPIKLPANDREMGFAEDLRRTDTDAYLSETNDANENFYYSTAAAPIDLSSFAHLCKRGCSVDEKGFELLLAMPLGNTEKVDVWLITNDKEITLVQDGLVH